ncbi:minor capsid protein, partial [Paenibacillus popilliae]
KINEDMITNVLSYPWSGADFSARLWENKRMLHFHLRSTISQGLIQGKSSAAMSKELSDRLGSSFKNAERLIRTETAHFHNEASKAAYNAAGVKKYEFMATLDMRTSDACRSLDGKRFKVSEAQAGVNFPPLHPWCRSTTLEHDPEDALDWHNSGQAMPLHMTYEEWYDSQVEEKGQDKVEAEEKKIKNKTADKKQFEKYKGYLGKDAPKSLQAFQEMKYNDPEEFEMMGDYRKAIDIGELSPVAGFKLYKQINQEIDKMLVGITTPNGLLITGKSKHFIARVIGSVEQRRNGVDIKDILKALLEPNAIDPVRKRGKSISQKFHGKNVTISVNSETGNLIQVNPRATKKED